MGSHCSLLTDKAGLDPSGVTDSNAVAVNISVWPAVRKGCAGKSGPPVASWRFSPDSSGVVEHDSGRAMLISLTYPTYSQAISVDNSIIVVGSRCAAGRANSFRKSDGRITDFSSYLELVALCEVEAKKKPGLQLIVFVARRWRGEARFLFAVVA